VRVKPGEQSYMHAFLVILQTGNRCFTMLPLIVSCFERVIEMLVDMYVLVTLYVDVLQHQSKPWFYKIIVLLLC